MDGQFSCFFLAYCLMYLLLIGKYVGNRPVKLRKAADDAIRPVEIGHKKAVKLDQDLKKKNKNRPY